MPKKPTNGDSQPPQDEQPQQPDLGALIKQVNEASKNVGALAQKLTAQADQLDAALSERVAGLDKAFNEKLTVALTEYEARLQSQIIAAGKASADQAVTALMERLNKQNAAAVTVPRAPGEEPEHNGNGNGNVPMNAAGHGLAKLFDVAAHMLEGVTISDLIGFFRPAPSPEMQAGQLLGMSLRLADKINKLQSGQGTISDLTQSISEALTPEKK